MTLKIGNRDRDSNKGFTLMEVMVATCILSLGAVLIYESFFRTLDAHNYYADYLNVASWMNEKIWETQDRLNRLGLLGQMESLGEFVDRNNNFKWSLSYNFLSQDLCQIDLTLFWQEGIRNIRLSRSAYALLPPS